MFNQEDYLEQQNNSWKTRHCLKKEALNMCRVHKTSLHYMSQESEKNVLTINWKKIGTRSSAKDAVQVMNYELMVEVKRHVGTPREYSKGKWEEMSNYQLQFDRIYIIRKNYSSCC